ncbi:MAG: tetratricopeptide repeat protein [Paracoccaceae bacterium]
MALALCAVLAACQSSEEKAEGHFAAAQSLLAEGDTPRALVELRNTLDNKQDHIEARLTLARLLREQGDLAGAWSQYQTLAQQRPDDITIRVELSTLLLSQSMWQDLSSQMVDARRMAPDDPRVVALGLALDYQAAVTAGDETLRADLAARAAAQQATHPDDPALIRIAVDQALLAEDRDTALALTETLLAMEPRDFDIQQVKLGLLSEQDSPDLVDAQFRAMIALFPGNDRLPGAFLQWLLSRNDLAAAESFLRENAGPPTGPVEGHVALIDFLRGTKGNEAALEAIDSLIAANADDPKAGLYQAVRASIDFEAGQRDAALQAMAAIIAGAEPSDQTRRIKVQYARMLASSGDAAAADARIAEVLAEDASHVDALRLRAARHVAQDRPADAIIDLRSALNQAPNDPSLLADLARAYLRDGNVDLATETLGRAVDLNPAEAAYARDYSRLLQEQGRAAVARAVLYKAWQANPANLMLIEMLSAIALSEKDWLLGAELTSVLRQMATPVALESADQFEAAALLEQDRPDEALAIFDRQIATATDPAPWVALKADALARLDRQPEAATLLADAIAARPDSRLLLHRQALLDQQMTLPDQAIARYRALIASDPGDELAIQRLHGLLQAAGDAEAARAVLAEGLAQRPQSPALLWIEATRLQAEGDLAGAIAIYETLYAQDSGNIVIANNLASLLSQTASDAATLDRAFRIARRLRASSNPAFQDTYGWLLHRSGSSADALPLLEQAAAALPEDGSVQYHHAAVLAALGRREAAIAAADRALALTEGAVQPQPHADALRALIDDLARPPAAPAQP